MSYKNKNALWFAFHPSEFESIILEWDEVEIAVYFRLILEYWRTGPILDNEKNFKKISGISLQKWKKIRGKLSEKFEVFDGRWHHHYLDVEIAKSSERIENSRKAGAAKQEKNRKKTLAAAQPRDVSVSVIVPNREDLSTGEDLSGGNIHKFPTADNF